VTGLQSHFVVTATLSMAVGYVMIRIGIVTRQLLPRSMRRTCSFCGRKLYFGSCDHCGS